MDHSFLHDDDDDDDDDLFLLSDDDGRRRPLRYRRHHHDSISTTTTTTSIEDLVGRSERGRLLVELRLERRFRWLAADASWIARGVRPTYRETLLGKGCGG